MSFLSHWKHKQEILLILSIYFRHYIIMERSHSESSNSTGGFQLLISSLHIVLIILYHVVTQDQPIFKKSQPFDSTKTPLPTSLLGCHNSNR